MFVCISIKSRYSYAKVAICDLENVKCIGQAFVLGIHVCVDKYKYFKIFVITL